MAKRVETISAQLQSLLAGASLEIDGKQTGVPLATWNERYQNQLAHGVTEWVFDATLVASHDLHLEVCAQQATDEPTAPVRFRYRLRSPDDHRLTKSSGRDAIVYLSRALPPSASVEEIRLADFLELTHTYTPKFSDVTQSLRDGLTVYGPIVIARDGDTAELFAFEHGSQSIDAFLEFALLDQKLTIRAVQGNYLDGQPLNGHNYIESPWFHFAAKYDLVSYRNFLLKHQSGNSESRKPYIFYNTWNYQERVQGWQKRKYLDEMNQDRMSREIDVAAKMGIDVFVIDTGWFEKTGDWQVNRERFPDGLQSIKRQLESHGMRLGLWFDNAAALSSTMLANHRDCVQRVGPSDPAPAPIWESEDSLRLCPVSRWWSAFADELIRVHRELNVSYFKLDAISQRGGWLRLDKHFVCDADTHDHGGPSDSIEERGKRYAYLLPLYMARIAERVREQVPDAILDFDMTEGGRCFGLAFLSASKFFLINNGPYYHNYQVRQPEGYNANLFFYPGPTRNALCRTAAAFDRVLPLTALLTHFFPDGPAEFQYDSIITLMLGFGGIWGDLCSLDPEGIARIGNWIRLYKQVRDDVTAAYPIQTGSPSGSPEIHEKINDNGRGLVAIFAQAPGRYQYVTHSGTVAELVAMEGVEVARRADGRALLTVMFQPGQTARVVLFGAEEIAASAHFQADATPRF
jgi:alpha-galactosidase